MKAEFTYLPSVPRCPYCKSAFELRDRGRDRGAEIAYWCEACRYAVEPLEGGGFSATLGKGSNAGVAQ